MEEQGWIALHRKALDNAIVKSSKHWHIWTVLLLMAAHKKHSFLWNGKAVEINPGQVYTSRQKLSKKTGVHESSIERILKCLETEQQIEQQKTTKFRIITIINWEKYQGKGNTEQQSEQQTNNKRTTNEQQTNTYNNEKNEKNENKGVVQKKKLFPLPGKYCCKQRCGMPAVWRGGGDYDNFYCLEHSPEKVRAEYC